MTNQPDIRWADEEPEISLDALPIQKADAALDSNLLAERFGKYLIVGELALGGMAELFLGVQRGLEGFVKVVVIKRVLPQFSDSETFVRMFIDEARLAARLEHRNIVRTYEFGEVDGQYFTVMEYLPGEDLHKVLNKFIISKQLMPFAMVATVMSQVCAGLHFAHELTDTAGQPLELVHRDVNPANIILTYSGDVKIIDFGVAKTAINAKTVSGTIKGKLAYMSPEQLLARGIDRRSDVFSTGVVLWELLTGRPLFVRESEAATIYAIMNDPIPAVSRYRADIPYELEQIVARALARTPADRYDSAEDLQNALDAFLAGQESCGARVRARMLEGLFGSTCAEAKRSIAQTRALAKNVSLVMKLRSEIRTDLAETVDALALGTDHQSRPTEIGSEREATSRTMMIVLAAVILAAIAAGVVFVLGSTSGPGAAANVASSISTPSSLRIESTPPGAAISIGGEPTGLKTPATLNGISTPRVTVRLELAGYEARSETFDIPASGTVTKQISFAEDKASRLVLAGLPSGASVIVDGEPFQAGDVIPVSLGSHSIRIVASGRTIVEQTLEAKPGDQRWKLDGDKLSLLP